jgi:hypothetical protein
MWVCSRKFNGVASQAHGIFSIFGLEPRLGSKRVVLGHVRRETARGQVATQCLGQRANVVWPGPSINTEVANVGREGFAAKCRDFVSRGLKRVERHGKRPAVGMQCAHSTSLSVKDWNVGSSGVVL